MNAPPRQIVQDLPEGRVLSQLYEYSALCVPNGSMRNRMTVRRHDLSNLPKGSDRVRVDRPVHL